MKHFFTFLFLFLSTSSLFSQVKPDANNTGTTGTLTLYTGDANIIEDGAILENLIINGSLNIKAPNVIIRNCLINTTGTYGIRCNYGHENILIEDCEIRGMSSAAVYGSDFTAKRCKVWDSGADGFKPSSNFLIESCYIYKLGYIDDAHADGVQMVAGNNGVIRWNNFAMPYDEPGYHNSQCIIMSTNVGTIDDILIEDNWINGGGYSVQIIDKGNGYGVPTNVSVLNNLFGRDHQFGPKRTDDGVVWQCNTYEDNGEAIGECPALSVESLTMANGIKMYPNPTSDYLNFNFSVDFSGMLFMYDVTGRQVLALTLGDTIDKTVFVNCSEFTSGIYFVKMKSKNKSYATKIIIE
ncbi:right-handed parallel beta-helix repeat-containing protein [Olleya sp. HaHaR_3_96]|uniref:right-handed parallel beta-helix repeat-containing protein n=1 Tax=Olleya sp. HaHaR_3_96 TaxID=2745560 RepID=UPI001C4E5B78|nr:right-handed parallel beta-helix repeat-containing protein [Olleya sp. HaHaR_3_96]QXP59201.1 T9SS type A sorting domain-containing protein [Olleya sp. HaHaR_3_96]